MKRSRARKKLSYRRRLRLSILVLAVLTVFLLVSSLAFHNGDSSFSLGSLPMNDDPGVGSLELASPATSAPEARKFYPYSVVPGGVRNPDELREAAERDRVVGEHYAGFDFQKAHVLSVPKDRLVYLSYRIGDKVYWTTRQVSLHKGEKLISDGHITARTRCGNQVSELPQKLASPQEPAAKQFDEPEGSSTQTAFPDNFRSALSERTAPALGPLAPGLLSNAALPGGFLPLGSPLAPGGVARPATSPGNPGGPGTGPGSGPGSGPKPPSGPNPPVSVPEPGTTELIIAELLAMAAGWGIFSGKKA